MRGKDFSAIPQWCAQNRWLIWHTTIIIIWYICNELWLLWDLKWKAGVFIPQCSRNLHKISYRISWSGFARILCHRWFSHSNCVNCGSGHPQNHNWLYYQSSIISRRIHIRKLRIAMLISATIKLRSIMEMIRINGSFRKSDLENA